MTKMIDLLEAYMQWRQYSCFRLDGSTSMSDRRDMVAEYQSNSNVFAFLLSTRAGGLGINLTGADTVIFYDSDWNPTIDAQAMDRAHRIGQTRQVTVYRLVCKDTIEERILLRAKQKESIQQTVYGGGFKMSAETSLRPAELRNFLLDETKSPTGTDTASVTAITEVTSKKRKAPVGKSSSK
jgi:DNA helicase INO80